MHDPVHRSAERSSRLRSVHESLEAQQGTVGQPLDDSAAREVVVVEIAIAEAERDMAWLNAAAEAIAAALLHPEVCAAQLHVERRAVLA